MKRHKASEQPSPSVKNITIRSKLRSQTGGWETNLKGSQDDSDFKLVYRTSVDTSSCEIADVNIESCDKENLPYEVTSGSEVSCKESESNPFQGSESATDGSDFTPQREDISTSVRKSLIKASNESNISYYTPKRTPVATPTAKLYSAYKACRTGERDFYEIIKSKSKSDLKSFPNIEKCSDSDNNETPKITKTFDLKFKSCKKFASKQEEILGSQSLISEDGTPSRSNKNRRSSLSDLISSDDSTFNPIYSSTKFCLGPDLECSKTPASKTETGSILSGIKKLRTPGRQLPGELENAFKVPVNVPIPSVQEEDIPCTQPVFNVILRGVVAYVEVRAENAREDYSRGVKAHLQEMGATISNTFTRKVTHVIFKSGRLSVYKKALKWGVKMVCVMWIEACKEAQCLVPVAGFTPSKSDDYNRRIIDEFKNRRTNPKARVTRARKPREAKKKLILDAPSDSLEVANLSPEETEVKEVDMMQEFLSLAGEGIGKFFNKISNSPTLPEDLCVPVSVNLLKKYLSPRKAGTDVKQHMNEIEKYCKLTSCGSRRLARLLFPDNDLEKVDQGVEDKSSDNSSLPQASNTEPSRRSAPARMTTGKRKAKQPAITTFLKLCDKKTQGEKNNVENEVNEKRLDTKDNHKNSGKIFVTKESKTISDKDKGTKDDDKNNDNRVILTQINNVTVRKRKLLPLLEFQSKAVQKSFNLNDEDDGDNEPPNYYTTKYHKLKTPKTGSKLKAVSQPKKKPRKDDDNHDGENKENMKPSRKSSSIFFLPKTTTQKRRTPPGIVCTGMQPSETHFITKAVEKLGIFQLEKKVSVNTTHVIAYHKNHRTVNLLKGIARGCWIVNYDWVLDSVDSNKWLLEEPYEFTHFSPAVKMCRLDRQAFGKYFSLDLFKDCGRMYVSPSSKPPTGDMKELITLFGGSVTSNSRDADLLIGGEPRQRDRVLRICEKWVLDSITKFSLLELDKYIKSPKEDA